MYTFKDALSNFLKKKKKLKERMKKLNEKEKALTCYNNDSNYDDNNFSSSYIKGVESSSDEWLNCPAPFGLDDLYPEK